MDIKNISGKIGRLSELAAQWEENGHSDILERDLALEILRSIYAELRFADDAPVQHKCIENTRPAVKPQELEQPMPENTQGNEAGVPLQMETESGTIPGPVCGQGTEEESKSIQESETGEESDPGPHPQPAPEQAAPQEPEIPVVEPEREIAATAPAAGIEPERESAITPRLVDRNVIRSIYGNGEETRGESRYEPGHASASTRPPAPEAGGTRRETTRESLSPERPGLKRSISLNDKFVMIREMFGGDADTFNSAMTRLDQFTDLDEAIIHIHETYNWNAESEGVKRLVELLERKLG